LYWIARIGGKRLATARQADAQRQGGRALHWLASSAAAGVGRYVPGLRFVINATFGLSAYRYPNFLHCGRLSAEPSGRFTCGLAYLVGTALADFPLASLIISGVITTAALGLIFLIVRRSRKEVGASEIARFVRSEDPGRPTA
jgi:membrane protein DedA with SNARE-associated domain